MLHVGFIAPSCVVPPLISDATGVPSCLLHLPDHRCEAGTKLPNFRTCFVRGEDKKWRISGTNADLPERAGAAVGIKKAESAGVYM